MLALKLFDCLLIDVLSAIVAVALNGPMFLGVALSPDLAKSSLTAYSHYLSLMLCFGALVFERIRLKPSPDRGEAISLILADVVYGGAGIVLLISGILRVRSFGQGTEFYVHNPIFWVKIVLFIVVGLISLYPTITYILWALPISKGDLPEVSEKLVQRLRFVLNIELIGFCIIPLFATLMARGVGI